MIIGDLLHELLGEFTFRCHKKQQRKFPRFGVKNKNPATKRLRG